MELNHEMVNGLCVVKIEKIGQWVVTQNNYTLTYISKYSLLVVFQIIQIKYLCTIVFWPRTWSAVLGVTLSFNHLSISILAMGFKKYLDSLVSLNPLF